MDITSGMMFLQRALPNIPMGSPLHTDILKAVQAIAKHAASEGEARGPQAQNMMSMVRQVGANQPQLAALHAMGGGPTNPAGMPAQAQPPGGAPPAE
jgi:hypothetical protein